MKIISKPPRQRDTGPKPPRWWRSWWFRTGTVVEHDGVRWVLVWAGAGDQTWRQWARVELANGDNS